jgi:hypothetical protein
MKKKQICHCLCKNKAESQYFKKPLKMKKTNDLSKKSIIFLITIILVVKFNGLIIILDVESDINYGFFLDPEKPGITHEK